MQASMTLTAPLLVISQIAELLIETGYEDVVVANGSVVPNRTEQVPAQSPCASIPEPVEAAPQPVAPVAAEAAPQPVAPVAAEAALDSTGLPWDERIHSSSKKTKADGTWMRRKRLPDGLYEQVEAELRAAPQPVAPVAAEAAPQPVAPVAAPQPVAPVAAPQPVAPVAAPQPVAVPQNLHELMQHLGNLTRTGVVTPDYLSGIVNEVNQAWAAHGIKLNSIADLGATPQVVPYIWQMFQRDGKVA